MLEIDLLNQTRSRLLTMHHDSGVGHIGGNLSALDSMMLVFHEYLKANDRFILSKGHSAGALYATLWSLGRLTDEDLKTFHKDDTLLAGHPPAQGIKDIAFATGSLGHGLSLAAGTALAWRLQNRSDHVFCITSDGEWQEGSTWEALIFAQHHRLDNLTVLVDHNGLQGFGSTHDVASMAPLWEKLSGFDVAIDVVDGHDLPALRAVLNRPPSKARVVVMKTVKGHGVKFMENRMQWHYLPMSSKEHDTALASIAVASRAFLA
jgi:transketolase